MSVFHRSRSISGSAFLQPILLGTFIVLMLASGCLTIVSVTQPDQVVLGANFQATVNFTTWTDGDADATSHRHRGRRACRS